MLFSVKPFSFSHAYVTPIHSMLQIQKPQKIVS